MTIWIDAQLSPSIAAWIRETFSIDAQALRAIGLRDAMDNEIFNAAKQANAIVMTKDSDFIDLLEQHGAPPKIIWLTCGNTSNERLKQILSTTLLSALQLLKSGEELIEISSDE
jgi:predicted nuclease of predicted toxin-antitoxin system